MSRRKKLYDNNYKGRHGANPDIHVFYELEFNGHLVTPGTKFKIKHDRSTYQFQCLAHNIKLDKTWVDAMCIETGEFRSFRIDKIHALVLPKKKRVKVA